VEGRFIGDNNRLLYDILFETKTQNIPGLLLSIDFEKAFDSISVTFIQKTLSFFGFGEGIQNWVKMLYNNISAYVIQNGHLSKGFPVNRGCRQGDPIAPYLFLICIQILICMIKKNDQTKGITINGTEHNISFYADDGLIYLDGTEGSLRSLMSTLNLFQNISGLKVNIEKTKAIWIGKLRRNTEELCKDLKLAWTEEEFTVLGVKFNVDITDITQINLQGKIVKMQALLTQWKRRKLTLLGKITIIKSIVIPLITHLLISLPNPKLTIKKIEKMLYSCPLEQWTR